jgi:hypothetical protein
LTHVIPIHVDEAEVGFAHECEDGNFIKNRIDPEAFHNYRYVLGIIMPFQFHLLVGVESKGFEEFEILRWEIIAIFPEPGYLLFCGLQIRQGYVDKLA